MVTLEVLRGCTLLVTMVTVVRVVEAGPTPGLVVDVNTCTCTVMVSFLSLIPFPFCGYSYQNTVPHEIGVNENPPSF